MKTLYEDQLQVIISKGFWLAETTVTQALWQAVMGNNPSYFQEGETSNFPVEHVSWDGAQDFIGKINQSQPGLRLRLPREAEWEYACRAGTETTFNFEGELTLDKVNYRGTWDDFDKWGKGAKESTTTVRSYPCNAWGLYEMHGNVWEWCEDDVRQEKLGTEVVTAPWLGNDKRRVALDLNVERFVRGGSWIDFGRNVRSAMHNWLTPDFRDGTIGLRFALDL